MYFPTVTWPRMEQRLYQLQMQANREMQQKGEHNLQRGSLQGKFNKASKHLWKRMPYRFWFFTHGSIQIIGLVYKNELEKNVWVYGNDHLAAEYEW